MNEFDISRATLRNISTHSICQHSASHSVDILNILLINLSISRAHQSTQNVMSILMHHCVNSVQRVKMSVLGVLCRGVARNLLGGGGGGGKTKCFTDV